MRRGTSTAVSSDLGRKRSWCAGACRKHLAGATLGDQPGDTCAAHLKRGRSSSLNSRSNADRSVACGSCTWEPAMPREAGSGRLSARRIGVLGGTSIRFTAAISMPVPLP